jgi:predicted nucleic acid-binding protein
MMKQVFVDTSYWIALANSRDQLHELALQISGRISPVHLVTTDEVLIEFANFYCGRGQDMRRIAVELVRAIMSDPNTTIVPQTRESFQRGLSLYQGRQDKEYSLVDCISMETMRLKSLVECLTNDHHFEQEGFTILLV